MAFSAVTRTSMLGTMLVAAAVVVLAGCSNSGAASAPAPTTTGSTAVAPTATSVGPGQGVPAVTSGPGPAAKETPGTSAPAATSGAAPQKSGQPGQPGQPNLPLDTKLYPPPNVPRSSGSTPKEAAYLQGLQKGGLTLTASGATEVTLGQAVCGELGRGTNLDTMKKLLVPAGQLAAGLSKSQLTGDQVADLYIKSAQANLC